jgi:hypothetical protein
MFMRSEHIHNIDVQFRHMRRNPYPIYKLILDDM